MDDTPITIQDLANSAILMRRKNPQYATELMSFALKSALTRVADEKTGRVRNVCDIGTVEYVMLMAVAFGFKPKELRELCDTSDRLTREDLDGILKRAETTLDTVRARTALL